MEYKSRWNLVEKASLNVRRETCLFAFEIDIYNCIATSWHKNIQCRFFSETELTKFEIWFNWIFRFNPCALLNEYLQSRKYSIACHMVFFTLEDQSQKKWSTPSYFTLLNKNESYTSAAHADKRIRKIKLSNLMKGSNVNVFWRWARRNSLKLTFFTRKIELQMMASWNQTEIQLT